MQARALRARAPQLACSQRMRLPQPHICEPSLGGLTGCHGRARLPLHAHERRSALGRIPSSHSQAGPVPLPGLLLRATWGSSVANCCHVGRTPIGFLPPSPSLSLHTLPPPPELLIRIQGVVLSQNFNVLDSGPIFVLGLLVHVSSPKGILELTLARGVGRSWDGTVTPAAQRGLCIKSLFKFKKKPHNG